MILLRFILLITFVVSVCSTCYNQQCTTRPECPEGYYFSGNYTFEGCYLTPTYWRPECCEVKLGVSNARRMEVGLFFNFILCTYMVV